MFLVDASSRLLAAPRDDPRRVRNPGTIPIHAGGNKKRFLSLAAGSLFVDRAGFPVPLCVCSRASHELTNHAGARKLPRDAIRCPSSAARSRRALSRPRAKSPAREFSPMLTFRSPPPPPVPGYWCYHERGRLGAHPPPRGPPRVPRGCGFPQGAFARIRIEIRVPGVASGRGRATKPSSESANRRNRAIARGSCGRSRSPADLSLPPLDPPFRFIRLPSSPRAPCPSR